LIPSKETIVPLEGGRSLRVLEAGEGPPVVLIHGVLAAAEDMLLGLGGALSARHRVISVDRPGHGGSRRQRFEFAPERQAQLIKQGLLELDVRRPVIVGHSLGCPVALAYALQWPDEVRGLVLLAPIAYPELRPLEHTYLAPRAAPWVGPWLSQAAHETVDPNVLPLVFKTMFAPQEVPEAWARELPHGAIASAGQLTTNGEDVADIAGLSRLAFTYRAIPSPTVVMSGDKDVVVRPERHARPLTVALPDARLEMLPGLGHMIHHFAADRIAAAVEAAAQDPPLRSGGGVGGADGGGRPHL
jgi:pimeloyl-ACP methyl ester carboxylesterase